MDGRKREALYKREVTNLITVCYDTATGLALIL